MRVTMHILEDLRTSLSGRYTIERELGAGGMATVYLAQDVKHDRKVALKVLRPELAAVIGAERFLAEIKTTANLQHPHILPLFDSGVADSSLFYVMPFIEGETVRDRLTRETQLPIADALRIAGEIAAALDYAHRRGVIHRDIKPENILLHDGSALVADFGIALAASKAGGTRMTETGMSLGTPHYMSPEQAMGERTIDARSDVYALGAVTYEMLLGEPPFTGPTAQSIVAKVISEKPARLTTRRDRIPAQVENAVLTALEKLPADRFASAAEFATALTNSGFVPTAKSGEAYGGGAVRRIASDVRSLSAFAIFGIVVAALAVITTRALTKTTAAVVPLRRLSAALPDSSPLDFFGPSLYGEGQPALAISRDGRRLAYVGRHNGTTLLFVRGLDEALVHPLAGTEGALQPFFSPDGEWIGFFAGEELKKIAVSGGAPVVLGRVSGPRGGVWTTDGRILVSNQESNVGTNLKWMPASGGSLTPVRGCSTTFYWPSLLPGERWVVGSSGERRLLLCSLDDARLFALGTNGTVRPDSVHPADLIGGSYPRYSLSGHLLYLVGNTLTALPFDPERLRVLGPPVPVMQSVRRESWDGAAQYAFADDGTLVFAPGADAGKGVFVRVDRTGRIADTLAVPVGDYFNIYMSPTGKRVAFSTYLPSGQQLVSLFDVERGLVRELPTNEETRFASWWPDGDDAIVHLGFGPGSFAWGSEASKAAARGGGSWRISFDGAGSRDSLLPPGLHIQEVSRDLKYFGVRKYGESPGVLLVTADRKQQQFLQADAGWPVFSPDSRWLAFASPAGLKISAVPPKGGLQTVGPASADEPEWSPRGDELYYRDGNRWMVMSVSAAGPGLTVGNPRLLFTGRFLNVRSKSYDVGPDGRFLLLLGPPEQTVDHLEVVTGFFTELQRRAPAGKK
jgi:hypothetical protein